MEFEKSIDPTYGGIPNSVGVYNYDLYTSCPYPYIYDYIADGGEDGWDEETESSYWVYNGVYLKVFDPDFGEEREYDGEEDPEGVWTFTGPFAIRGSRRVDSLKVAEDGTLFVD